MYNHQQEAGNTLILPTDPNSETERRNVQGTIFTSKMDSNPNIILEEEKLPETTESQIMPTIYELV